MMFNMPKTSEVENIEDLQNQIDSGKIYNGNTWKLDNGFEFNASRGLAWLMKNGQVVDMDYYSWGNATCDIDNIYEICDKMLKRLYDK